MNEAGPRVRQKSGWVRGLAYLAVWIAVPTGVQSLTNGAYGPASAAGGIVALAVVLTVWQIHREGRTARAVIGQRRERSRSRLDSAEKVRACAPEAAGVWGLLASCVAAMAALGVTRTSPVRLPSRLVASGELGLVGLAVIVAILLADYWLGASTTLRVLRADRVTAGTAAITVVLAACVPALALAQVRSRAAWAVLVVVLLAWGVGALIVRGDIGERRKRAIWPRPPRLSSPEWLVDQGPRGDCDVILESAGDKKILIVRAVRPDRDECDGRAGPGRGRARTGAPPGH